MDFSVLTYNILDYNLASNTILRTMNIDHKEMLVGLVTEPKIKEMEKSYSLYFHRDTSGKSDKNFKRKLWGAKIDNREDLEKLKETFKLDLSHITYENNSINIRNTDGTISIVENLRMLMIKYAIEKKRKELLQTELLQTELSQTELSKVKSSATELHEEILAFDETVMNWSVRGPKIAETIKNKNADIVMLQEYGSCHEKIYSDSKRMTLREDLHCFGYNCIFFLNPKYKVGTKDGDGRDGSAIYYKRTKFIIAPALGTKPQIEEELIVYVNSVNEKYDYVRAFDIDAEVPTTKHTQQNIVQNEHFVIEPGNKRSVGFVKLKMIENDKKVLAMTVHLMTDTSDKLGLVKIEELKLIKNKLAELTMVNILDPTSEGIVFGGDFNTKYKYEDKPRYSDRDIFQSAFGCSFDGLMNINNQKGERVIILEDIIKDNTKEIVSSVNGTRKEWIDYIYFSNNTLSKTQLDFEELNNNIIIPDNDHPSDHIPIMSTFKFKEHIDEPYHKKYLKYKQKYVKLKNKYHQR